MTIKAAVIGDPISHSLSPKLHGFLLQKYNVDGNYSAIHVKSENLAESIKSMINEGFTGFNITIPHKEKIFHLCDIKTKNALLTKAVNTITITENKKILGENSDIAGFINNLKHCHPNFNLKNKTAHLIGAGGASRAIVCGLINCEAKTIFITNRNQQKALDLINDFKNFAEEKNVHLEFLDHENFEKSLKNSDLLTNATSLGMTGQPPLALNLENLNSDAIVYDIVYKPLMTNLLRGAQNRGNKIVTGIGMLAFQAIIGFESWFGVAAQVDDELINYLTTL